jgi:two-component system sensor histidine kinase YesM
MLELEVTDTGPGFPESRAYGPRIGVGLNNTRARLEQLYGGNYTLELTNRPAGGALVRIRFPYRRLSTERDSGQVIARQA